MLINAYGDIALYDIMCREWFHEFKKGQFDVVGKEYRGRLMWIWKHLCEIQVKVTLTIFFIN